MRYNLYNKLLLQLRCNDLDSTIKASTCTMSKYYSYMFYADRNVRPCTILGYTLTTFPKSLIQSENNKKNLHRIASSKRRTLHSLLKEYHDIFLLVKHDMGHLKLMLDAGVIHPSNSPWCNAIVLVRKKDRSLRFCIDFRRLNSLTVKDSHPLPCICETLESLAGAAHFLTFNMNSGFWQVPMDEESKQYTAFTLGSMGLYECERCLLGCVMSRLPSRDSCRTA